MFDVVQRLAETNEAFKVLAAAGRSIPPEAIEIQWQMQRIIDLEAELAAVDAALSRRPAMNKKTRAANIEKACNAVDVLREAIGTCVPSIIRCFLKSLPSDAAVDRDVGERTLLRIEAAMQSTAGEGT